MAKSKIKICEGCSREFQPERGQSYCDDCHVVTCSYCGVEFTRLINDIKKTERHFCSMQCRNSSFVKYHLWTEEDKAFIKKHFFEMSEKELCEHFDVPRSSFITVLKQLKLIGVRSSVPANERSKYKLCENCSEPFKADHPRNTWCKSCLTIICATCGEKYTKASPGLVKRSKKHYCSFDCKAAQGSWKHVWGEDDIQFLKENYATMYIKDIAEVLNFPESSVIRHIQKLGLKLTKQQRGRKNSGRPQAWTEEKLTQRLKKISRNRRINITTLRQKHGNLVSPSKRFFGSVEEALRSAGIEFYTENLPRTCDKCGKKFTPKEVKTKWCKACMTTQCEYCGKEIVRPPYQIQSEYKNFCNKKCSSLGNRKANWTDEKIAFLKDNYSTLTASEISAKIGIKKHNIESKVTKLGLKLTKKQQREKRARRWGSKEELLSRLVDLSKGGEVNGYILKRRHKGVFNALLIKFGNLEKACEEAGLKLDSSIPGKTCKSCGKTFHASGQRKWCDACCSVKCTQCGKDLKRSPFEKNSTRKHFCDKSCMQLYRKGVAKKRQNNKFSQ